jgi:hypothetical protein
MDSTAWAAGEAFSFARDYHERCEAFDRTVCTGPVGRDGGVLPATPAERVAIERNAIATFNAIAAEAERAGIGYATLRAAISTFRERA